MNNPALFDGLPVPERPHVVILGAGASIASFPNGDVNGKKLPSMKELEGIVDLKAILAENKIEIKQEGFEEIYSELHERGDQKDVLELIEERVANYFEDMELPDEPTIYDYLVLGLREKDIIATFNWDPLLMLALERNFGVVTLPDAAFLHGNTRLGFCSEHEIKGPYPGYCAICGNRYERSRLLYPIMEQDYRADQFISGEWGGLTLGLVNAMVLSIFGYGVPDTDVDARHEIDVAWNLRGTRDREEIEIINIESRESLIEQWQSLFVREHFRILTNFSDSFIANFPRRSCEAYFSQFYFPLEVPVPTPAPLNVSLRELQDWFRQFDD